LAFLRRATGPGEDIEEATGIFRTMQKVLPSSAYGYAGEAAAVLKRVELRLPDGKLWAARDLAVQAMLLEPALGDARIVSAVTELAYGCRRCASQLLDAATGLEHSQVELLRARALLARTRGNSAESERLLKTALNLLPEGPQSANVLNALASLYAGERRHKDAEAALDLAIWSSPQRPQPYASRAQYFLFTRGDADAGRNSAKASAKVGLTLEAKRLEALADYLAWAQSITAPGILESKFRTLAQQSILAPDEAFSIAARHQGTSVIVERMLSIRAIANVDVKDGTGNTALMSAISARNLKLVEALLLAGANPNSSNQQGERPLTFSVKAGDEKIVELLISRGADPFFLDSDGHFPLKIATYHGNAQIVSILLRNPLKRTKDFIASCRVTEGDLLALTAYNDDAATARLLLEHGFAPTALTSKNQPVLIAAVIARAPNVVAVLMDAGASPHSRYLGRTAFEFARAIPDAELIRILERPTRQKT
jgi:tetratricopeptide (TPR) repeat protein